MPIDPTNYYILHYRDSAKFRKIYEDFRGNTEAHVYLYWSNFYKIHVGNTCGKPTIKLERNSWKNG